MTREAPLVETRPTGHGRARGLVSGRSSGGRIGARTYQPSPELADDVSAYWCADWDLRDQDPHVTELIGDPVVHLAFEAGAGLRTAGSSRVVGVWTRLWRRTLEGVGLVRAVKLKPGAAGAFLPGPAWRWSNKITPLRDVFGDLSATERAILEPSEEPEAFAQFERWLCAHRRPDTDGQRSLAVAVAARITSEPELTRVESLAEIAGLSMRELQRLFREHVGASPKHVIRWYRLQEVALRIERGEVTSLAQLAADLGYTDQAHLAHDFKNVTGKSPSAFGRDVGR